MGILQRAGEWLGLIDRSLVVTEGTGMLPPSRDDANALTVDRALTIPSVYRSINVLATAVTQLDLDVFRRGEVIPQPALIARPDVYGTRQQFLKRTVIGLSGWGNGYWFKHRDPANPAKIINLEVLNPGAIFPDLDKQGRRIWRYSDPWRGPVTLRGEDVQHLRLMEVPGHVFGLGPIQACRVSVHGALALRDYAQQWTATSDVPTGTLSSPLQLTPDQIRSYKAAWKEQQAGAHSVAVLGGGLKYEPILISPKDAQFLESQQFTVTDIARLFGIPASVLLAEVNGSSLTYSNLEMVDTQFVRYTLMQYLAEIEAAFTALLPYGQTAKFDLGGLLRPDARTRAQIWSVYKNLGVVSPAYIAKAEGFPEPTGITPTPARPALPAQETPA